MKWSSFNLMAFSFVLLVALPAAPTLGQKQPNPKQENEKKNTPANKLALKISEENLLVSPQKRVAVLSEYIRKHKSKTLEAADAHLAEHGFDSIGVQFADAVIDLLLNGQLNADLKWSTRETAILTTHFKQAIDETLDELRKQPFMQPRLSGPTNWEGYEKLLWDVHVFRNRVAFVERLCEICEQKTARTRKKSALKKQPVADNNSLTFPFDKKLAEIRAIARDLEEREIELRIYRLEDSTQILKSSKDKAKKLLAGFAMQHDYDVVRQFYQANQPDAIRRSNLKGEGILESVDELMKLGQKHGKEQIEKGTLLMTGLHWWLRGRYGAGPLANGQLKPKSAMKNPAEMFSLYMPRAFPKPTPPNVSSRERMPTYDRRHYYQWAVEYRPVTLVVSSARHDRDAVSSTITDSKLLSRKIQGFEGFW